MKIKVCIIIIFLITSTAITKNSYSLDTRDPNFEYFLNNFIEAYNIKNQILVYELIEKNRYFAYKAIIWFCNKGLDNVIRGYNPDYNFNIAKDLAMKYEQKYQNKWAMKIVELYSSYDKDKINIKNTGDSFYNISVQMNTEGKYEDSLSSFKIALKHFKKINDFVSEGKTYSYIGDVYYNLGQYKKSIDYKKKSLIISDYAGDEKKKMQDYNFIAEAYWKLHDQTNAIDFIQKSFEVAKDLDDKYFQISLYIFLSDIYIELSNYKDAYNSLMESKKVEKYPVQEMRMKINKNLAYCYRQFGKNEKAIIHYEEALAIVHTGSNYYGEYIEAIISLNLGEIYLETHNLYKAMNLFNKSSVFFEKEKKYSLLSQTLCNISLVNYYQSDHDKAIINAKKALDIAKKLKDIRNEAFAYSCIALIHFMEKNYEKSINYYNKSFECYKIINDIEKQADILFEIGTVYSHLNQNDLSLKHYKKAFKYLEGTSSEDFALLNLGLNYVNSGNYNEAIKCFERSIFLSEQNSHYEVLWKASYNLGLSVGNLEEAPAHFEQAIEAIEAVYNQNTGLMVDKRIGLISETRDVFEDFIDLLVLLHHKYPKKGYDRQAFLISEKIKSRVFIEILQRSVARSYVSEVDDSDFVAQVELTQWRLDELSDLKKQLTRQLSIPEAARNNEVVQSIKDQIIEAELSLQLDDDLVDKQYPEYADLRNPRPLQVEDLQAVLADDETLLSYSVGEESFVAFVIGNNSFQLTEIDLGRDTLRDMVKTFRQGISNSGDTGFDPLQAHEFYKKIFAPILSALSNQTKIYISADDVLYTIPFDALVDQPVDADAFLAQRAKWNRGEAAMHSEFGLLHYLVDSYTLTYLPSASVLRSLRTYEKPGYGDWTTPLIAFADPVFDEDDTDASGGGLNKRGITRITEISLEQLAQSTGTARLNRLRQTAEEALSIRDIVGGSKKDIYLRQNASEENVYNAELQRARFVLFATHGFLGGEFEGMAEPVLALSLVGNSDDRDGLLSMSEVLGLDLNAEMVALSACNTSGEGERAGQGEGFAGLTRSFMYAGAKSLLVTHWSVESSAARDLMVDTFKKMKQMSKPAALRAAKLKMKSSTRTVGGERFSQSNPYFWAPFVLVGEGG